MKHISTMNEVLSYYPDLQKNTKNERKSNYDIFAQDLFKQVDNEDINQQLDYFQPKQSKPVDLESTKCSECKRDLLSNHKEFDLVLNQKDFFKCYTIIQAKNCKMNPTNTCKCCGQSNDITTPIYEINTIQLADKISKPRHKRFFSTSSKKGFEHKDYGKVQLDNYGKNQFDTKNSTIITKPVGFSMIKQCSESTFEIQKQNTNNNQTDLQHDINSASISKDKPIKADEITTLNINRIQRLNANEIKTIVINKVNGKQQIIDTREDNLMSENNDEIPINKENNEYKDNKDNEKKQNTQKLFIKKQPIGYKGINKFQGQYKSSLGKSTSMPDLEIQLNYKETSSNGLKMINNNNNKSTQTNTSNRFDIINHNHNILSQQNLNYDYLLKENSLKKSNGRKYTYELNSNLHTDTQKNYKCMIQHNQNGFEDNKESLNKNNDNKPFAYFQQNKQKYQNYLSHYKEISSPSNTKYINYKTLNQYSPSHLEEYSEEAQNATKKTKCFPFNNLNISIPTLHNKQKYTNELLQTSTQKITQSLTPKNIDSNINATNNKVCNVNYLPFPNEFSTCIRSNNHAKKPVMIYKNESNALNIISLYNSYSKSGYHKKKKVDNCYSFIWPANEFEEIKEELINRQLQKLREKS